MSDTLYVVVPCYNEEEILNHTAQRLADKIEYLVNEGTISADSMIVFVDDGSKDSTWDIIKSLSSHCNNIAGIKLSCNAGHQNALYAGLMSVKDKADVVISIDADLQDDINAIDDMLSEYAKGNAIVYGVRTNRASDKFFKRASARCYYKILMSLGCDIIPDHADYRLMDSRSLEALSQYGEQRLFIRGIIPMLGYKTSIIEYTRGVRKAGKSKYPLKRMLTLAVDGITALSLRPLRLITILGVLLLIISAFFLFLMIVSVSNGEPVFGWKLVMFSIWVIGGIITLSVGIVGEYIGRVYNETKKRPRYFVEEFLNFPE